MGLGHDKPTIRTATMDVGLTTGGLSEDVAQIAAERDSRILAVQGGKNATNGFVELSLSSNAAIAAGEFDEDAATIWVLAGDGQGLAFGDLDMDDDGQWIGWDEDEEIHVHTRNNTGSLINSFITVYYVEEVDC